MFEKKTEKIANQEEVNEIRYLGVTVTDRKRILEKHKREMNVKMNRMMTVYRFIFKK